MCEVVINNEFSSDKDGLGCTISLSNDGCASSSAKRGFFESLSLKSNKQEKKEKPKADRSPSQSGWFGIFAKKSTEIKKDQEDEKTAELIQQLQLEGRSDAEIAMHLSCIHDVRPAAPVSPKSKSLISQWFSEVHQAIKEEFSGTQYVMPEYEYDPNDVRGLTVSISTAPFYGAVPPDMDMSYEELASLEPVYVGSKCVNNLPTCKFDGSPLPGDQTNCPVCLCEFTEGEKLKSLPCVHFFHDECIDRWLMVGHTCPVCKLVVE